MKKKTPCWSISGRKNIQTTYDYTPGPGTYSPGVGPRAPKYTIGSSQRKGINDAKDESPGPGAYAQKVPYTRGSVFGTSVRRNLLTSASPGPGTYKVEGRCAGPAFSLRPRIKQTNPQLVPGPGQYTPSKELSTAASPRWPMARSTRAPLKFNGVPGPGMYPSPYKVHGPYWRFGSAQRGSQRRELSPGPGTYNLDNC